MIIRMHCRRQIWFLHTVCWGHVVYLHPLWANHNGKHVYSWITGCVDRNSAGCTAYLIDWRMRVVMMSILFWDDRGFYDNLLFPKWTVNPERHPTSRPHELAIRYFPMFLNGKWEMLSVHYIIVLLNHVLLREPHVHTWTIGTFGCDDLYRAILQ